MYRRGRFEFLPFVFAVAIVLERSKTIVRLSWSGPFSLRARRIAEHRRVLSFTAWRLRGFLRRIVGHGWKSKQNAFLLSNRQDNTHSAFFACKLLVRWT